MRFYWMPLALEACIILSMLYCAPSFAKIYDVTQTAVLDEGPQEVDYLGNGLLAVTREKRISLYTKNWTLVQEQTEYLGENLVNPQGCAVDRKRKHIYFVDAEKSIFFVVDYNLNLLRSFGPDIDGATLDATRQTVFNKAFTHIYVANSEASQGLKINIEGTPRLEVAYLQDFSPYEDPQGIALDEENGRVYLLSRRHNIFVFEESTGTYLFELNDTSISKFNTPLGAAVDLLGNLIISVTHGDQVAIFEPPITHQSVPSQIIDMYHPQSITQDLENFRVYITDNYQNVTVLTPLWLINQCNASCQCPPPAKSARCENGSWIVPILDTDVIIVLTETTIVGDVSLTTESVVVLSTEATVIVQGCADISKGTLNITLDSSELDRILNGSEVTLDVIRHTCSDQNIDPFNNTVITTDGDDCVNIGVRWEQRNNALFAVLSGSKCTQEKQETNLALILGVSLSAIAFIIIVGIVLWIINHKKAGYVGAVEGQT